MNSPISFSSVPPGLRPRTADRAELAEWAERLALHDLYAAAPASVRATSGLFVERVGPALGFGAPGIDSLFVNRIFLGEGDERAVAEAAGRMVDTFAERGVRRYFVHVPLRLAAGSVASALETRGVTRYHRDWVKLARGPGEPPAPQTPYPVRAANASDGPAFAVISALAFGFPRETLPLLASLPGRPRWHVYVAVDGALPIATGALFAQGDVGYLTLGATLPGYRGRGVQRALLAQRVRVAQALGCRTIVSETGSRTPGEPNSSYDNMVMLGMEPVAVRQNFAPIGVKWS
jgi:GNAT superfamily N-acetyltransferase